MSLEIDILMWKRNSNMQLKLNLIPPISSNHVCFVDINQIKTEIVWLMLFNACIISWQRDYNRKWYWHNENSDACKTKILSHNQIFNFNVTCVYFTNKQLISKSLTQTQSYCINDVSFNDETMNIEFNLLLGVFILNVLLY